MPISFALYVGVLTFTLYQCLKLLHHFIRNRHLAQKTGMLDLPLLGMPRKDGKKISGTAVICGGSIAGLASARICSDHFERVIIVEPEGWLSTEDACHTNVLEVKQKRTRLMQWDMLQGTQVWSVLCLRKLFPVFDRECGASDIRFHPADTRFHFSGMQMKAPFQEYEGAFPENFTSSRAGFEMLLRRLIIGRKDRSNIRQIHGTVIGFKADPESPRNIREVLVRQGDNETITIPATLVLDCTGPARAGVKMIRRLGFGISADEQGKRDSLDKLTMKYDQSMYYSSISIPVTDDQLKRLPKEVHEHRVFGIFYPDSAKHGEKRVIFGHIVDRNIVQFGAGKWGDSAVPTTLDGFEEFCRSPRYQKPVPEFWYRLLEVLKETEEKTISKNVRVQPSIYTPFHRVTNMPSNWVAVGDSAVLVNPVFGQGISKIFLDVATLNTILHGVRITEEGKDQMITKSRRIAGAQSDIEFHRGRLSDGFAKQYFASQAQKMEPIWNGVKGFDYNYDTTTPQDGETLSANSFLRRYVRATMTLATKDSQAGSALFHVFNFLAPPIDYFHPSLVPKVLWEMVREWLSIV